MKRFVSGDRSAATSFVTAADSTLSLRVTNR